MKNNIFIIICILIICFILIIIKYNTIHENYENIDINLGNVLSDYYYKYVLSILKKEDFNYSNDNIFSTCSNSRWFFCAIP